MTFICGIVMTILDVEMNDQIDVPDLDPDPDPIRETVIKL